MSLSNYTQHAELPPTRRQQAVQRLLDVALAVAIGTGLAWLLVLELSK